MVYLCVPKGPANRRPTAAEHWNWPAGATVSVACYTNCAEVELTLNGKSLGVQPATAAVEGVLTWQIPYEAGALKAAGRNGGREVCSFTLETAGAADHIELVPDVRTLRADGNGVCQLEVRVVDARGIRVPDAAQEVTFAISGPAELLGLGNGDLDSTESCRDATHAAFQGRGLAFLRSTDAAGDITIRATAPGLEPAVITINSSK
jgi:beta-galactosidase